jgi:polyisoprenoid-binding protein YceI
MTSVQPATLRTFAIDRAHSEVAFQVRHLLSRVRGRFSEFDGTIVFDEAAPEQSSVTFTIQTGSIDTNEPARDAHLRSEDFFAAERMPTITFVSTSVAKRGDRAYDVTGVLSIRGVTKTIVLPVEYLGTATDPWGKEKLAFEAEITLNRKDFGLNWNAALETGGFLVGDEVKVMLAVQAAEK